MGCSDVSRLWLEILSVKGISALTWERLHRTVPAGKIALMLRSADGRDDLSALLGRRVIEPDGRMLERQLHMIEDERCSIVSISDEYYPSLLREIAAPPPLLFYRGELSVLEGPVICIVGSRRSSRRGIYNALGLARDLSVRGIAVASGMARGIDSAAHEGALKGRAGTCAVLGCGIDIPYPPENAGLGVEISAHGCLITEFPPGTPPLKRNFPRRNRILSGVSLGTVVIEATPGSGAMGTAGLALDQNREVFAVPGPIEYQGSRGPHRLIRQGAALVETVEDILAELPPCGNIYEDESPRSGSSSDSLSEPERELLSALEIDPKHIDELVEICHISAASILPVLLGLELKGIVESCGSGTYALSLDLKGIENRGR